MKEIFKILSIDGGGIRGVYPAKYLTEIQKHINNPIYQYFDLITGTSTGGIIAIALAMGIDASEILEMYRNMGTKIFKHRNYFYRLLQPKFLLFHSKYSNKFLKEALIRILDNKILGEAKTRLCIPTIELVTGRTKVYKTNHHPNLKFDWKIPAWKVALATSAAPTYFPTSSSSDNDILIDGGLWANNPSLVGILEAKKYFNIPFDQIKLLSIGTCTVNVFFSNRKKRFGKQYKDWGVIQWAPYIFQITLNCHSLSVENMVTFLNLNEYIRINDSLPKNMPIDDVDSIPDLECFAAQKAQNTLCEVIEKFFNVTVEPYKFENNELEVDLK